MNINFHLLIKYTKKCVLNYNYNTKLSDIFEDFLTNEAVSFNSGMSILNNINFY